MRILFVLLLSLSFPVTAIDVTEIVAEIKGTPSIQTLANLAAVDKIEGIGAALCNSAGSSYCEDSMTLGAALCRIGGGSYCHNSMTLGEALCKLDNC